MKRHLLGSWELALVVILAGAAALMTSFTPYFFAFYNLIDSALNYSSEIDVSVASIVALAAVSVGRAVEAFTSYPSSRSWFDQQDIAGLVPVELAFFAVIAILFAFALHFTIYGRRIYATGTNPDARRYVGINVARYCVASFAATGLMYDLAAILLSSRLGRVPPLPSSELSLQNKRKRK